MNKSRRNIDDKITTMQNSEEHHKETADIRPVNWDFNPQPLK
jgi:hypothetical protein